MKNYRNRIICDDTLAALRQLPDDSLDLGITSPPYNKQEKNHGGLVSKVIYASYRDAQPEDDYQSGQVDVLDQLWRATRPGGSFFYNHKLRYQNGLMFHPLDWLRRTRWLIKQELVWDRTIAGNIRGWRFWPVDERIFWLYKPVGQSNQGRELESKDAKLTSIWRGMPEADNPHPAPFPLWLPARIILSLLKTPGLVCDPYAGSGTTLVAAKLLGHDYLGIDLDRGYCRAAERRLTAAEAERDRLDQEIARHRVVKSYAKRKRKAAGKRLDSNN